MLNPTAGPSGAPVPTSARLSLTWIVVLLAMVLLVAWAGQWSARRESAFQADALRRSIDVYALGLRGEAAKFVYLPFTVAQHPDVIAALASPGDTAMRQRANRYLEDVNRRAGSDALYVLDTRGNTLIASNWNQPLTFVGQNYGNRPYFIDAVSGGSGHFYGIGRTTGEPGLFLSAPLRSGTSIVGVVAVKVSLLEIQQTWGKVRDPVMLADARGIFFLGSVPSWMYQSTRAVDATERARIAQHATYGPRDNFPVLPWDVERTEAEPGYLLATKVDGIARRFMALDESLPNLGWTLTVMADYGPVTAARNRTWTVGALIAGLLLLGTMYWRLRERRYAEQRVARQELELRVEDRTRELGQAHSFRKAMEDSLLVGMRARDLKGKILYVNPAFCEMTGYRADELVGKSPPYIYWHPDDLKKHRRESDAVLAGNAAPTGFESRLRHRDGHDVYTMVYTAPLIDHNGEHSGWMSSVVDISEQKMAELRQRKDSEKLQHMQRLASLGELAATLAHELGQPLMALNNFAGAAKANASQGRLALLAGNLDDVAAQAKRAGDIVRSTQVWARPHLRGAESCDLNDIVTSVLAMVGAEIRHHQVRVSTRLDLAQPCVSGVRILLEQVLVNLVLNSLQAMQVVAVELRELEISTDRQDDTVRISVADRGPGVAADVMARVFDPYFTTKPEGTGLGLNICRRIVVENHQGALEFENRPDGGAVFVLVLKSAQ
jgi:two-component system sensor histidine kinase DctS